MTNKQPATRNSHYVPRFYLKRWSTNGNTINCYHTIRHNKGERLWKPEQIGAMPVWRDLYTNIRDGQNCDEIERYFTEIENKAAKTYAKIDKDLPVDKEDINQLVNLAIAQMARTPKRFAKFNETLADSFSKATGDTYQRLNKQFAQGDPADHTQNSKQCENPVFPDVPIDIQRDEESGEFVTRLLLGRSGALYAMGRVLEGRVASTLKSYKWALLDCPKHLHLPTSDNPFITFRVNSDGSVDFDCGIGLDNVHIAIPITPAKLLHTCVNSTIPESVFESSPAFWDIVYAVIARSAHLYIYLSGTSLAEQANIEKLRPSVIDPKYLKELDRARQEWLSS